MTADPEFRCIYPCYINKNFTIAQGRRLKKELCADTPTIEEMAFVVQRLNIPCNIEHMKKHPRDFWNRGRLKVKIQGRDGPINPKASNKNELLGLIAQFVPKAREEIVRMREERKPKTQTNNKKKNNKKKKGKQKKKRR